MRLQVLSSGSKGNSLHLNAADTNILIDVGLSCKETIRRMELVNLDPFALDAILVTHEHSDHIRGISVFSRRFKVPAYLTAKTWKKLLYREPNWFEAKTFDPKKTFTVGKIKVTPFRVPHDTIEPVAYSFESEQFKFGMATDLGAIPQIAEDTLKGSDLLYIESNHDEHLLFDGSYPQFLKNRISSRRGHLSNAQTASLISRLLHPGLQAIVLGHLSEENNTPELAYQMTAEVLQKAGTDIPLIIAKQYEPTKLIVL